MSWVLLFVDWLRFWGSLSIGLGCLAKGSWKKFIQRLDESFSPSNEGLINHDRLHRLRQGSQPISDYIERFKNLCAQAGITDDLTKISFFTKGLDSYYYNLIYTQNPSQTDINEWYKAARTAATMAHLKQSAGPRSNYQRRHHSSSKTRSCHRQSSHLSSMGKPYHSGSKESHPHGYGPMDVDNILERQLNCI